MILQRLYELAEREALLDDPAFETLPVPLVLKIGEGGKYLGVEERRGEIVIPVKKGPPRTKPDRGKELRIPKAHGNSANSGFARFFSDTLARVLPVNEESKSAASRETFWRQMQQAATAGDPALQDIFAFGRELSTDGELAARVRADVAALNPGPGDRCTFAWYADEGLTILERASVQAWWREFYSKFDRNRQDAGPRGLCQVTGTIGPIATVHATKLPTLPGGLASGVSLISNDKAAFESYGLDRAANACVGYRAADGYTRAVQALIQERLHPSKIVVGGCVFLFWGREKGEIGDLLACLNGTDPEMVKNLFDSVYAGRQAQVAAEASFYCLMLSGNDARAVVRDYLEAPIADVKENLRQWFTDLRLTSPWGDEIVSAFPFWQIAKATARDSDAVSPTFPGQLLGAAMRKRPVGDEILAAAMRRLKADGSAGFSVVRLGLIKLILLRKGIAMSEQVMDSDRPAYVCGRLMAVFERAQWGALGDVNANVVDRYYGTASTAPGLVFPRLFKSAQQHIGKLQNDKHDMAVNIQKDLEALCSRVSKLPHLLTLNEQGEFALGFYHQRAEYHKPRAE